MTFAGLSNPSISCILSRLSVAFIRNNSLGIEAIIQRNMKSAYTFFCSMASDNQVYLREKYSYHRDLSRIVIFSVSLALGWRLQTNFSGVFCSIISYILRNPWRDTSVYTNGLVSLSFLTCSMTQIFGSLIQRIWRRTVISIPVSIISCNQSEESSMQSWRISAMRRSGLHISSFHSVSSIYILRDRSICMI